MLRMLILTLVWLYVLYVVKKAKLKGFTYIIGSVGFFIISFILTKDYMDVMLVSIGNFLEPIGRMTGVFNVNMAYSVINVLTDGNSTSFYLTAECSGLFEGLVFISVMLFFPLFTKWKKVIFIIIGVIAVAVSNIVRILMIVFLVKMIGANSFFVAHTIVSRLIFYSLVAIIYFTIFTASHIRSQKVGKMHAPVKTN